MKSLLAKTLSSLALAPSAFTGSHAASGRPFPSPADEVSVLHLPSLLRYLDRREAAIAKQRKK
jgi:hypothetical protein